MYILRYPGFNVYQGIMFSMCGISRYLRVSQGSKAQGISRYKTWYNISRYLKVARPKVAQGIKAQGISR
jgi:hypothetical protein